MAIKVGALPTKHRYLFQLKAQKAFANVLKEKAEAFKQHQQHTGFTAVCERIQKLADPTEGTVDLAPLESSWKNLREEISKVDELHGLLAGLDHYDAAFDGMKSALQETEKKNVMLEGTTEEKEAQLKRERELPIKPDLTEEMGFLPTDEYIDGVNQAFTSAEKSLALANEEIGTWLQAQEREKQTRAQTPPDQQQVEVATISSDLKIAQLKKDQESALMGLAEEANRNLDNKREYLQQQVFAAKALDESSLFHMDPAGLLSKRRFEFSMHNYMRLHGSRHRWFGVNRGLWKLRSDLHENKDEDGYFTKIGNAARGLGAGEKQTVVISVSGDGGELVAKLSGYGGKGAGAETPKEQKRILEKLVALQAELMRAQRQKDGRSLDLRNATLFLDCPSHLQDYAMELAAKHGFGEIKAYYQRDKEERKKDPHYELGTNLEEKYKGQIEFFNQEAYKSKVTKVQKELKEEAHGRYETSHAAGREKAYGIRTGDVVDLNIKSTERTLLLDNGKLQNPADFMNASASQQDAWLKGASPEQLHAVLAFEDEAGVFGLSLEHRRAIFQKLSTGQQAAVLGHFVQTNQHKGPLQFEDTRLVSQLLEGMAGDKAYGTLLAIAKGDNAVLQHILESKKCDEPRQLGLGRQFMRCLSGEAQAGVIERASERKQNVFDHWWGLMGAPGQSRRRVNLREDLALDLDITSEDAKKFNDVNATPLAQAEILDRIVMRYEADKAGDRKINRQHIGDVYKSFYGLCNGSDTNKVVEVFNASPHPEKLVSHFLAQQVRPENPHPKSWESMRQKAGENANTEHRQKYVNNILSSEKLNNRARAAFIDGLIQSQNQAVTPAGNQNIAATAQDAQAAWKAKQSEGEAWFAPQIRAYIGKCLDGGAGGEVGAANTTQLAHVLSALPPEGTSRNTFRGLIEVEVMKDWRKAKEEQQEGQPQGQAPAMGLMALLQEVSADTGLVRAKINESRNEEAQLDALTSLQEMLKLEARDNQALTSAERKVTQAEEQADAASASDADAAIEAWGHAVDDLVKVKKEVMDRLVTRVTTEQLEILKGMSWDPSAQEDGKLALQTFINKIEIERNLLLQISDPSLMKAWVGTYDEKRFAQLSSFLLGDQPEVWKQNFAGVLLEAAQAEDKRNPQQAQSDSAVMKILKLSEADDKRELLHHFAKNYHSLAAENKTLFKNYILEKAPHEINDKISTFATLLNQMEGKEVKDIEKRNNFFRLIENVFDVQAQKGPLPVASSSAPPPPPPLAGKDEMQHSLFQKLEAGEKRKK